MNLKQLETLQNNIVTMREDFKKEIDTKEKRRNIALKIGVPMQYFTNIYKSKVSVSDKRILEMYLSLKK